MTDNKIVLEDIPEEYYEEYYEEYLDDYVDEEGVEIVPDLHEDIFDYDETT